MTRQDPLAALLLCLPMLLVAGCTAEPNAATEATIEGHWILVDLGGQRFDAPEKGPKLPEFSCAADGKINGYTGLNQFNGQLDVAALKEKRFAAGPLATTRRGGPPRVMEIERSFLAAIQEANVVVSGGLLSLERDGVTLATFKRAP